jgi:hypothetical protein
MSVCERMACMCQCMMYIYKKVMYITKQKEDEMKYALYVIKKKMAPCICLYKNRGLGKMGMECGKGCSNRLIRVNGMVWQI